MKIYIIKAAHEMSFIISAKNLDAACKSMKSFGYFIDWSQDDFNSYFDNCTVSSYDPADDII